jgi:hypothetical protein
VLPGGLLFYLSTEGCRGESCPNPIGLVAGGILIGVGAPVGMAAGITGGGNLLAGQGHMGAALGGLMAGGLGGYLLYRGVGPREFNRTLTYVSISTGALAGGILSYELSHLWMVRRQRSGEFHRVSVLPMATVTQAGSVVGGVIGHF